MSVVKFHCPNAHPLSAPAHLVGKAGKCPKCQASFVVPAPEPDRAPPEAVANDSGKRAAEGGSSPQLSINLGSGIKEGSGSSKTRQDVFVFLCPNGHRLNGPPSLKGKLGQCPHCNAKFRVPEDDPQPEVEEFVEESLPEGEALEEIPHEELEIEEPEPPFEEGVHPLAHIVSRLWHHKGERGELELLLPEGELMQPEHYSETLSSRDYGVFATGEGMGFSFTVIPWISVRRINVHKVDQLPPGAFPE